MTQEPAQEATPSKTARKREAERLQDIGRRLGALSADALSQLNLPDALQAALADYQRFPSHGAKRRQLQFIGKLMRDLDTSVIEAQLAALDGESAQARHQFKQVEQWRERLLNEPDAVTEFIAAYPSVDRQQLRQQLKKLAACQDEQQHKTQSRQLFRFLREVVDSPDDSG
jgi:ribosome-associated protein